MRTTATTAATGRTTNHATNQASAGVGRRKFTAQQKVAILRRHLVENVPVSDVCEQHGIKVNMFYRWQKEFFENGAAAFERQGNGRERTLQNKVGLLESKLAGKDEVIAEIMASHVQLKKSLGPI